jgi:hypothetical protein
MGRAVKGTRGTLGRQKENTNDSHKWIASDGSEEVPITGVKQNLSLPSFNSNRGFNTTSTPVGVQQFRLINPYNITRQNTGRVRIRQLQPRRSRHPCRRRAPPFPNCRSKDHEDCTGCHTESNKLSVLFLRLPSPLRSASPCSGDPGRTICFPGCPCVCLGSSSILSAASRSSIGIVPAEHDRVRSYP